MRIERTGPVEPLTPKVIAFLSDEFNAISLDDIHSHEASRIDYVCLRGLLAVEMKSLEESGSERIDNFTDQMRDRDDWPMFLGSAPMQSFIKNMNDPEGVQRKLLERIGRNFINHLKKANRQFEAHCRDFGRTNVVRILIFINEDHELFDPHTVSYILWHAVRRKNKTGYSYGNVDGILYLTQRHASVRENKVAFPVVMIEGTDCWNNPWKGSVLEHLARRWAKWNGHDFFEAGAIDEFETIDHIPEVAPRSERWRTEYKRNPYLRALSIEELRERFDEVATLNALAFLKGSPIKFEQSQTIDLIRQFGELTQEMEERGTPITEFQHSLEREEAACRRLGLPNEVIGFLKSIGRA